VIEFRVRPDGKLTYIGQTKNLGFPGLSGLAAS
jgi:hypothetical protein